MRRVLLTCVLALTFACGGKQSQTATPKAPEPDKSGLTPEMVVPKAEVPQPQAKTPVKISIENLKFSLVLPDDSWDIKEDTDMDSPILFSITHADSGVSILHLGETSDDPEAVAKDFREFMEKRGFTLGPVEKSESPDAYTFTLDKKDADGNTVTGMVYTQKHPVIPGVVMIWMAAWPEENADTAKADVDGIVGSVEPMQ